jgi:hypothetical protein
VKSTPGVALLLVLAAYSTSVAQTEYEGRRTKPRTQPQFVDVLQPQTAPPPVVGQHVHVDDFAGLSGEYAPLRGSKSLWFGRRADPSQCFEGNGYGRNWVASFQSDPFPGAYELTFLAKYDVESSYDFIYIERQSPIGWQLLGILNGSGTTPVTVYADYGALRIRLVSDWAFDAEDGNFPSVGLIVDSLVVTNQFGQVIHYEDFEGESVGDLRTTDFKWYGDQVYTVGSTDDSGPGSLRDAINYCNTHAWANVINFNIPGPGPHTIAPLTPLPPITDYLVIDGYSQPGASVNTAALGAPSNAVVRVELMGFNSEAAYGLDFQARGELRGLAVGQWGIGNVLVSANDVMLLGNHIGADASGLVAAGSWDGVTVWGDRCFVGGCAPLARNIIAASALAGVVAEQSAEMLFVQGNYIGVGSDAITPLGVYNYIGVRLRGGAHKAVVGSGLDPFLYPATSNVIANSTYGVLTAEPGTDHNWVIGNAIRSSHGGIVIIDDAPDPISAVIQSAGGGQISGQVSGMPSHNAYLHFYRSTSCDPVFNRSKGEVYIGREFVNLGVSGTVPFNFTLAQTIPAGSYITVTATQVNPFSAEFSNTSEFSPCVMYDNTPLGLGVQVDLLDSSMNLRGSAVFEEVNEGGHTTLTTPYLPSPVLSSEFYAGNPNDPDIYFDIATTADFTTVDVCLFYDENSIPGPEAELELVHYNAELAQWEAVTFLRDELNNRVCGTVSSLSPFVIAVLSPTGVGDASPVPSSFALHASVPNPFNPITTITYDVPAGGADVSITIYDVSGKRVREIVNARRPAGSWSVQWNGVDDRGARVASGVYFYRMRAGAFVETRKMVLLK